MLRDFLRYPSVFKKSVRGKMFLFYRNLKLCPQENFIKMLPEGAILWVRKTPVLGHLKMPHFKSSIRLPVTVSKTLSPGIFLQNDPTSSQVYKNFRKNR